MVKPAYSYRVVRTQNAERSTAQVDESPADSRLQRLANKFSGILYQLQLDPNGTFSFLYLSSGCRQILGLEPEQIQQNAAVLLDFIDREQLKNCRKTLMESAKTLEPWRWEGKLTLADGQCQWVQTGAQPERQPGGEIIWDGWLLEIDHRLPAEIERSQQPLTNLIQQLPVATIEWDIQGNVTAWNRAAEKLFGYREREVLNSQVIEAIVPEEIRGRVSQIMTELIQAGKSISATNENVTKDGRVILCNWYNTPRLNAAGEAIGVISMVVDMTEHSSAEAALEQSEIRFRTLVENLPGAIYRCLYDAHWTVEFVSEAIAAISGYPASDFIGNHVRALSSLVHPDDARSVESHVAQALADGTSYLVEYRIVCADGSIKWVQEKGQGIFDEEDPQKLLYLDGVIFDITERKKVEQERQKLAALVENSSDAIAISSLEGQSLYLNEAGLQLLGFHSLEAAKSLSVEDYFFPEELPRVRQTIIPTVKQQGSWHGEVRLRHAQTHEAIPVEYTLFAVKSPETGLPLCFATIVRDIRERQAAEAELQQTRRFLESVLEHLPVGVAVKEAEGLRFVFWNPTASKLLGFKAEEVMGKDDYELFPPEQAEFFVAKDREVLEGGCVLEIPEETILTKQGETKILHTRKTAIVDREGNPQYLLAIVEDITERKRAESALTLYKQAVESTSDAIAMADPQGNHFYQNPAFSQLFECETVEAFAEFGGIPAAYSDAAAMQAIFQTLSGGRSWSGEVEMRSRSNRRMQVLLRANPIKDSTGNIIAFLGSHTDISDRKQAEESLRQSEQRFRDASEAVGEYLWEIDANGAYTFITDKAQSVKGYTPEQLLGCNPLEFIPEEDIEAVRATLQEARDRQGNFRLEHRGLTPSGEVVWEEVNGVPLFDEQGEITGFRGAGLSITDRKRAEIKLKQQAQELENTLRELQRTQTHLLHSEKMSSLGQLVAGVAHEINNPINFIHGNLDPARDYANDLLCLIELYQKHYPQPPAAIQTEIDAIDLDFLKEDFVKLLDSMRIGTDRIREIVLSLRNFSRLDEAEFKTVDLHDGLDSTLMILQNRLKAKADRPGIEVAKHYGLLPKVECYPGQLNQVFMNILVNALDALEERDRGRTYEEIEQDPGKIWITTTVERPGWACVRIRDNGPGIPKNLEHRIFDPFFTTKAIGKGTGLGMSIGYQIVTEKHHGSIRCISSLDRGTEFVVEIPLEQQS